MENLLLSVVVGCFVIRNDEDEDDATNWWVVSSGNVISSNLVVAWSVLWSIKSNWGGLDDGDDDDDNDKSMLSYVDKFNGIDDVDDDNDNNGLWDDDKICVADTDGRIVDVVLDDDNKTVGLLKSDE